VIKLAAAETAKIRRVESYDPTLFEYTIKERHRNDGTSWSQVGRALYLPHELMGFAEGTGLFWLAGMANGVRFFAPPYWKIEQA
jgi:hypothetical protein